MRGSIAANTRWSRLNAAERLIETKPGRDAALEKLIDEFDPDRVLSEEERLRLLKNAQTAQMDRIRLAASRARTARARRRAAAADADVPVEPASAGGSA